MSTVSITANPTAAAAAARRRPVGAGGKKRSNVELVSDGIASPFIDNNVLSGGADAAGDGDNDRGGSSKALSQERSLKPKWLIVLSLLTKILLVLLFLSGLIQVVSKLSDVEGRIAEFESYVKTTTEMLQGQVEAVEKKMEGEIAGLRSEMDKKFDKYRENLGSRLKKLDEKAELLEKGLSQLTSKDKDFLTKQDFGKLYEEMKKSEIGDLGELARLIVAKEMEKHAGDGLGRADHALATGGARVMKHSEPLFKGKGGKSATWFTMANPYGVHIDSVKVLTPSFGEPGQCFPLKGSTGFVQIRLRKPIIPEAVTVEDLAKSVAYDRSSAPRDFRVYGWLDEPRVYAKSCVNGEKTLVNGEKILLTEFSYDLDKSNAQTFNVVDSASSAAVDMIRFDYTSNHGSPSHTCIYRLRVHGHDPLHGYPLHLRAAH